MAEFLNSKINKMQSTKVNISSEKMSATLNLAPKSDMSDYTVAEIVEILNSYGVNTGIDYEAITKIVSNRIYSVPCTVARGVPAVNGENGHFNFNFRTNIDSKPTILPDGSVDYRTKEIFESVHAGDIVATYTPATEGKDGKNVIGTTIPKKPGKDLSPLKGSNFVISEDRTTYTSAIDGKIEVKNDTLVISDVLEVQCDVDLTYGNIDFNGNVYIRGGVLHGATVKANGDVVVCGNVEDAFIYSAKNIELKSGMQGIGKGRVECNGDLYGKFFENAIIRVKGDLNANSMMNCDAVVQGRTFICGRHGIIVGGTVNSLGGITATTAGNMAELKTSLTVGISPEFSELLAETEKLIIDIKERISKIDTILSKIYLIRNPVDRQKLAQKRAQAEFSKDELMRQCTMLTEQRADMIEAASSTSFAKIVISKYLFPGVNLCVNGAKAVTKTNYTNVIIKAEDEKVCIINNV